MNCPLCGAGESRRILQDTLRPYYCCAACTLIFVPASDHSSPAEELKRYDLHDNTAANAGYVRFLNEIVAVVDTLTPRPQTILDFGSGKNSVLSALFTEKGYACTPFDPLYNIGPDALGSAYDTVVLCEVIEHVRDLGTVIASLRNVVRPGGTIIIRTQLYKSAGEFKTWWYKEDPTHINFFSRESLGVLAERLASNVSHRTGDDIFVLHTWSDNQ